MTTIKDLRRFKQEGHRFAMLTAYDYTTARLLDDAGIPVLLVGDSLGMVILGYPTTLPVTLEEMIHHCKAVARGAASALLVGDLPFGSYQVSTDLAVAAASRLLKEAGMHAVKLEGAQCLEAVNRLVSIGIPVMGHLGLTPQSVHQMGGFKVQGRSPDGAARILEEARALEQAGAFSLVLEGMPAELARRITQAVSIPTIGIGAGPDCDGQVLVVNDLLGLTSGRLPRFVKQYATLAPEIVASARAFAQDVAEGSFPAPEHSYSAGPVRVAEARLDVAQTVSSP